MTRQYHDNTAPSVIHHLSTNLWMESKVDGVYYPKIQHHKPHLIFLVAEQHDDVPFPRTLQTTSRRQPPMHAIDDTRWIMKTASTYANRGGEVDESGGGWNNNILVHRPNLYSAWTPITHSSMIMQWRYTFSQHTTPLKATTYTAEVSGVAEANTASIIRYEDADHASRHCWENDVQRQPKGTTELKNKIRKGG